MRRSAAQTYELGPAVLLGFTTGAYWDFFSWLRFTGLLCYNYPIWGNELTLGDEISYDRDVEVTNEREFNEEFNREAKQTVKAGGFGFSLGAAILL